MTTPHHPAPPTPWENADLTARLRDLTGRRADDADRAAFFADKQALLDRIADDQDRGVAVPPPMTAEAAARALASPNRTLDDARTLVRKYLDDVSEQVGVSVHRWGLDEQDLHAIETGASRDPDAAAPPAGPEQDRRAQLIAWQAGDAQAAGDDLARER